MHVLKTTRQGIEKPEVRLMMHGTAEVDIGDVVEAPAHSLVQLLAALVDTKK